MVNKIVSAHGGRWSDQQEDLIVPQGSKVVYYVNDGEILTNDDGYNILAQLQAGEEPGGSVIQQVNAGSPTCNYSCWNAPEFQEYCGIFAVGEQTQVASLQEYTEDNPLLLSQLFDDYPNCTIYWVCCREISNRESNKNLTSSAEAWPQIRQKIMSKQLNTIINLKNGEINYGTRS